jgi:hypothetical protein
MLLLSECRNAALAVAVLAATGGKRHQKQDSTTGELSIREFSTAFMYYKCLKADNNT